MYKNKRAFTLIELLVVVLIIGILSAIALPQYTKAVQKARLAEVAVRLKSLEQAVDLYVLENGFPSIGEVVDLFDVNPDLTGGLTKKTDECESGSSAYGSKYAWYKVWCTAGGCYFKIFYSKSGNPICSTPDNDLMWIERAYNKTSGWATGVCTYGSQDTKDGPGLCSVFTGYRADRD